MKKHEHLIPASMREEVLADITKMHRAGSEESYDVLKQATLTKWKKSGLTKFSKYFGQQWLNGKFCNWQLFQTPPGYAMTNNSLESYNNEIKRLYTDRKTFAIQPLLPILASSLKYEACKSLLLMYLYFRLFVC